ncbi:helix-turn-helix transcriptional regulator [Devosia nitrariae]|uniref:DeoR family transcriptional regulator n=1 Tax=Devosia nitrariae TaxID=2071872 RepID=A0ABQ5W2S6_9HYPH|nr:YafY family protein [Devosia nitrariae]GLQ54169.1 DeoR family transcriptional regulator [Devosia nitrariae]
MAKRSERLLALMQALRRRRRPATGQVLAEETGVSLRSLYRDIETLKSMGAAIDGEAGLGFQLRADYFLPPLMFSNEEIEALVLGLRTQIYGRDAEMGAAARDALAKVSAILPESRRDEMEAIGLFALPPRGGEGQDARLADLRRALRAERQVEIAYCDLKGVASRRVVYPVALGYYEERQVLVAWCTLRQDYRRFRIDGMGTVVVLADPLPEPRRTLFHRWRTALGLPELT